MTRAATAAIAQAQTKVDEEAVHNLPQASSAAFNKWIHGKPDFEKYHTRLLNGRFHGVKFEVLQVAVRFLRPDIAIVHWSWTGTGDKNPDGTTRKRRLGMMTMVAEKRAGSWLVVASQNDDSYPGVAPEFEGITSPMPMPDQVGPMPSDP